MDYKITNKAIDKLKYDLVREGLLDYNQLIEAIELAKETQTNLGQVLINNKTLNEESLLNFLEQKLHIPYVNLDDYSLDHKAIELITPEEAHKYKIIPLFIIEDTLTVAMADPLDLFALNNLSINPNFRVEPVICSERTLIKALNTSYGNTSNAPVDHAINKQIEEDIELGPSFNWQNELSEDQTEDINSYRLLRAIIYQALQEKASDIHFDPQQDEIIVRFRIDGFLYNRGSLPVLLSNNFISKVKSAAGLDINNEQTPQSGRMEVNVEKNTINARLATFPSYFGEKLVIRIFDKAPALNELGLEPEDLATYKKALNKDSGLILAAGSLCSGGMTTLYSSLEHINSEHKNIMTIENPIRYNIDKVNQTQIAPQKNFCLNNALNSIFYQEPDVIYIYDITDLTNLDAIVRSAIDGQLILTSILADSAIGALYRLIEKGIPPSLVSAIVNLTINQKLIRILCPKCKIETTLAEKTRAKFNLTEDQKYFQHNGCKYCNNTGYKGRVGIFEILSLTEETSKLLSQNISETEFSTLIRQTGHQTLLDSALNKVKKGITSIEEVNRIFKF